MQEYLAFWKNYVNFKDRTSVKGYWMAILFNIIAAVAFVALAAVADIFLILYSVYALAVCIPGLSICIRRLHDTNRCGWWIFLSCIPLVGAIILLVFLCQGSVESNNRYGSEQR